MLKFATTTLINVPMIGVGIEKISDRELRPGNRREIPISGLTSIIKVKLYYH